MILNQSINISPTNDIFYHTVPGLSRKQQKVPDENRPLNHFTATTVAQNMIVKPLSWFFYPNLILQRHFYKHLVMERTRPALPF